MTSGPKIFIFFSTTHTVLLLTESIASFSEKPVRTGGHVKRNFSDFFFSGFFWCNTPEKFPFQRTLFLRALRVWWIVVLLWRPVALFIFSAPGKQTRTKGLLIWFPRVLWSQCASFTSVLPSSTGGQPGVPHAQALGEPPFHQVAGSWLGAEISSFSLLCFPYTSFVHL